MASPSEHRNSFASGEIAEDAWERADLQQVATGCEEAFNFVGLTTGAMRSRTGFYNVGAPKHQGTQVRYFDWKLTDGEGLVLEMGELYARVWTARGAVIETSPGSGAPYEFSHGYSAADLAGLRLKQVGDIGYFTSRDGLLNITVQRTANNAWASVVQDLRNGPWMPENIDAAKVLTLTDLGGNVVRMNCTGGWTHFTAQHVGAKMLVRPPGGYPGMRTWAPNTVVAAGAPCISGGRVYVTLSGGTTGNTPPTHEQGSVSDGGVTWRYEHDGATAFVIDTVNSATEALTHPVGTPPMDLTLGPSATTHWSDQAISQLYGYPTAQVAVREERLAFAGTRTRPDTIEFTRTAGFTPAFADFKPGLGTGLVVDDDACRCQLGDVRARVIWMVDAINFVVGTTEAEWIVAGATVDDPLTPASTKGRRVSSFGSADVMPLVVQGPPTQILHVARGGTTVRELVLGGGGERDAAGRDLSILAQHVFGKGVVDWAWSRPDNNIWIQLADGSLACMTYHYEHGIIGVRRQPFTGGWAVESLCASPDDKGRDRLHVGVIRVKGGAPQRLHFVLSAPEDGVYVDCAEYYEGPPVSSVAGLSELEGETVFALADGAAVEAVVNGGSVTLPAPAAKVIVGQPIYRKYKSLPFDPGRDGQAQARKGRPSHMFISIKGVEAVVRSEPQDEPDERAIPQEKVLQRRPGDIVPVARRKRAKVVLGSGADRDVRTIVETYAPYELTLYSTRPHYEVAS